MKDVLEKTSSSSLSIVEKKPQRPGGCVGIFFQLFDWNRRFAKKKLFSKKLLPPVRVKPASKKFGGDDKKPKHRLIADENSGGFPNSKKSNADSEQKQEMRAPSLVARLMGLESMPALHKEKSKKVPSAGFGSDKPEKFVDCVSEHPTEDWNSDKGGTKLELRPQKLQKTSFSERRPMARFGAEALPFRNVLSKSKKHHQKLPSPVKSPRNLSRKNASKLIGAAAKILEPGLQRSRLKCALTYTNGSHHLREGNSDPEEILISEPIQLLNPSDFETVARKREMSCKNCGYMENLDSKPRMSEQELIFAPSFSHYVGPSCDGSERCKSGQPAFCQVFEEETNGGYFPNAAQVGESIRSNLKLASDRKIFSGHIRPHNDSDVPSSFSSNQQIQSRKQMLGARYTSPQNSKLNGFPPTDRVSMANVVNERKNHISPTQSGNNKPHMSKRMDNGKFEMEKRMCGRHNDLVPGRKRRPVNVGRQAESSAFANSTKKQTYGEGQCYTRGNPRLQQSTVGNLLVDNNVSFVFNSPMQQKGAIHAVERKGIRNDSGHGQASQRPCFGENGPNTKFDSSCSISGDSLGALLEQKLKELTCQGEDCGSNAPKKTTAMILQELISALTSEIPFQQKKPNALSDVKINFCDRSHSSTSTLPTSSQANAMPMKTSIDQPFDSEHLSPGSVLEACFSNDSCLSSSFDDNRGYKITNGSVDCSHNEPYTPKPDMELLDSATSRNFNINKEFVGEILDSISKTLSFVNPNNLGLKGIMLNHVKDVLLNSELVLRGAAHSDSFGQESSPVRHLLLDELETLVGILWMSFGRSLGGEGGKEQNQLHRFALDAIMEYLDLKFVIYPGQGSKVSTKLPLCINPNSLLFAIVDEVRKWGELSRFFLDELVEWEMGHSLGEWTRFDTEMHESGVEISSVLFHVLLDEFVTELRN